jgi:hypothetical protein
VYSKNKPRMTLAQAEYTQVVASLSCAVCSEPGPSEVHEPEQGLWYASIPLCRDCHRGPDGWHGTRLRWTLRRINELQAINNTVGSVIARKDNPK